LKRLHDLLHPGVITVVTRRQAEAEAAIRVTTGEIVVAPRLERERRIHHDAVELTKAARLTLTEVWAAQAVESGRLLEPSNSVEKEVDPGDVCRGRIALLHVEK